MQYLDKLIEYHFQRKISGVGLGAIRKSLEGQPLEDDERALILKEVQRREEDHIHFQMRLRYARYINLTGVSLALISVVFLYLIFILKINYSYYIGISLFLFAVLALFTGYFISRKRISFK